MSPRTFTWMLLAATACSGDKSDSGLNGTTDNTTGPTDSGDTDTTDTGEQSHSDDAYAFVSAATGQQSVSYSGQVLRQVLIDDMKSHLGGLTDRLNTGFYPVEGEVAQELEFYLEFDSSVGGQVPLYVSTDPAPTQTVYDDISSGKNLLEKLAGNDTTGQHKDWSTEFVGWNETGGSSPEALVRQWMQEIDTQAVAWSAGDIPLDPSGSPVPAVYVTPDGRDLQQLLQKFLRGAVAFSQGADDYLDDDLDGKGLNADHTAAEDGEPFTALEHQWDEAFGYFGASRSYPDWTDADISDTPGMDVDGDGTVDLLREMNWGHSVNAAKRDLGAVAATDFTAEAWSGFYSGRALLADTAGTALTADQKAELAGYRDTAVAAWEKAIAATVVHFINDTLQDMGTFDTEAYDFGNHAKHWSEMKGFALALQFNPRSPLSDEHFALLHDLLGDSPTLENAEESERDSYAAGLVQARDLLGTAYAFDTANLGDSHGENGW